MKAQGRHPVTSEEGAEVARKIGAQYAEVSAMQGLGVEEVFDLALREALKNRTRESHALKRRKFKCVVV